MTTGDETHFASMELIDIFVCFEVILREFLFNKNLTTRHFFSASTLFYIH